MGIKEYDDLIEIYDVCLNENRTFSGDDMKKVSTFGKYNLSSKYNLDTLTKTSCDDLLKYANFLGGSFKRETLYL
jgi:hypothetical protein